MHWIDDIVLGLIDTYGTNNPYELCDALNIFIIKLEPVNKLLQDNHSVYIRDFYGKEIIFIRNNLHKKHELFYLRHELGHAILQPDIEHSLNKDLLNIPKFEKQADYFALKLSNIELDEIQMYQMTYEQIASCIEIPARALKQLVNL